MVQIIAAVKAEAQVRGLLLDLDFMNDASNTQSPLKSYGAEVFAYLDAVGKIYDSAGVFRSKA